MTKKDKYSRLTLPKELLRRLDKYCETVVRGKPKIRNLVIRNAIEEFLHKQERNWEAAGQMKRISIYILGVFHLQPPLIYRPVQTKSGPIFRL